MNDVPDLEASKADLIRSVIRFYHEDFTEYYATVIALTEKMPEQINNEIRNAFSHLARVYVATSVDNAKSEADKARGHIERACRDCLKASIIAVHDTIENQYNHALIRYQGIAPKITGERKAIRQERVTLAKAETKGANDLTGRFRDLLERSLALHKSFEEKNEYKLIRLIGSLYQKCLIAIVPKYKLANQLKELRKRTTQFEEMLENAKAGDVEFIKVNKLLLDRSLDLQMAIEEHYGTAKGMMPMWLCILIQWFRAGVRTGVGKAIAGVILLLVGDKLNIMDNFTLWWHNIIQ